MDIQLSQCRRTLTLGERYLLENMDWFEEELGDYDNDYLIIDCPGMWDSCRLLYVLTSKYDTGQIELYTHHRFFPSFVSSLSRLGIRTCAVYLIESQFMEDKYKFFRSVTGLHMHCILLNPLMLTVE